ncbi:hypothetical protein BG74_09405 [Sodalis-like endosymbiont of Proechinophthirus fluctus]|nr:hypothetical protein [Sodalis-like endosymbiont of Proechinophthirus fluctus]KYP95335.1 hypothetical protein BG74_09405 [Sodalis-like endosymbiont of Proechinophthirus fluctus]
MDVPLEMDDGTIRHFEGFRVQHKFITRTGKRKKATCVSNISEIYPLLSAIMGACLIPWVSPGVVLPPVYGDSGRIQVHGAALLSEEKCQP